jgi:hypothetical protein
MADVFEDMFKSFKPDDRQHFVARIIRILLKVEHDEMWREFSTLEQRLKLSVEGQVQKYFLFLRQELGDEAILKKRAESQGQAERFWREAEQRKVERRRQWAKDESEAIPAPEEVPAALTEEDTIVCPKERAGW